ncbi:MAG: hypothetical protein HY924_16075 [Elusimicrobia bacterium]|nr:hypothetical protein [Elusimicrobiota bacterium]
MNPRRWDRDAWPALFFAVLALLPLAPAWLAGLTPFWGDLTYLHHPWRALPAQLIQAGRLPWWNPFVYFGMPMAASMQGASFSPGTLPFHLFAFPTGLALFHWLHYWMAGWLMYLWLRSLRLSSLASLAGGVVYCLGGLMLSRMQFLNHLAVLSLAPALLLFFRRPALLALALASAFLAGYPVFLPGLALAAWAMRLALKKPGDWAALGRDAAGWLGAAALAMGLVAMVLVPGAELAMESRRSGGMGLAETLAWGFEPEDWVQWVSPLLVPLSEFDAATGWWKCCYLGFAGWFAAGLGLAGLGRRKAAGLALIFCSTAFLVLGGSTSASLAVWKSVPVLALIRYPGNLSYLAWPCLALLAAAGVEALRRSRRWGGAGTWAGVLALTAVLELAAYGAAAMPSAERGIFSSAGPLVRRLQEGLGPGRYLLSPRALESTAGWGVKDWKWRLYGLTNAPFRLPSAGNFGEPLVPAGSYAFMDLLYNQPGADAASRLFRWCGVSVLLTPGEVPVSRRGGLQPEGSVLWELYRLGGTSRAYWFDEKVGASLPADIGDRALPGPFLDLPGGKAVGLRWTREDRFVVEGTAPAQGWVYVAETFYPGWQAFLESGDRPAPAERVKALSAFQKLRVPAGPFRLLFRYDPWTWQLGLGLSLACMVGFCLYWYNRLVGVRL